MQDDEIILSPAKYKELEHELGHLTTTGRREIAERIKDARAMGDLSENFDYHDAKRQQGFLEGRIDNIKQMLERAKIAEYETGGDIAAYGSTVKIHDIAYEEDLEYKIVGVMEADTTQRTAFPTRLPSAKLCLAIKSAKPWKCRPLPAWTSTKYFPSLKYFLLPSKLSLTRRVYWERGNNPTPCVFSFAGLLACSCPLTDCCGDDAAGCRPN